MSPLLLAIQSCLLAHTLARIRHYEFAINNNGTKGEFIIQVDEAWAPLGAARFHELFEADFFPKVRFFRAISGFMAQFGIHGKPEVSKEWREKKLLDDPVVESNKKYTLSFATSGKDSRTTQIFINFADNANLDGMGFSPFGKVISGFDAVDAIVTKFGEGGAGDGKDGKGPSQQRIQEEGNYYLRRTFPELSYIESVIEVAVAIKDDL